MCGGVKFSEFQVDCLEAHNIYRDRHGMPPLDLNKGLCKYAEDHAKHLCECGAERPSKGPYGENIFIKTSSRKVYPDAYEPVMQWYGEVKKFSETTCYPSKDIKHFTNVVWKSTKSLGVGYAIDEQKKKIYVVVNYFPPGGDYNTFSCNVAPMRKNVKDCPSKVKLI